MKRLHHWWLTKYHSTLSCCFGAHGACQDPSCWCDHHFKI